MRLAGERETLGLYLTGHPIAEYERELAPMVSGRIADLGGARPVGAGEGGVARPGPQRHAWRVWCSRSASAADAPASCSTTAAAASR